LTNTRQQKLLKNKRKMLVKISTNVLPNDNLLLLC